MQLAKLDDSPMLRNQIECLEENAESLKERTMKFYKGCRKYAEGLGEGYNGDVAFASALEAFGGCHNDPLSVAFGGALREIGTYKETLRAEVEHVLTDRLLHFVDVDLHDVKEARKRFDKAIPMYDQAREKFLSLRKSTRMDIAQATEEELHNARSIFEQARFNLVSAISNVEAKKRFEFLEAVSVTMAAHLRFFRQGYELLNQMEPYINQVLGYAQQSRESSNYEQASLIEKMQDYIRQIDYKNKQALNGSYASPSDVGMQPFNRKSHKEIEAVMQSAAKGKVQTIRQGYLSKRSSNLRGDWKRRFFVLDSRGMLYYYRKQWNRSFAGGSQHSNEPGSGLLSRWLSSHYHGGVHDEKSVTQHTVNLLTATIKLDADQSDLRFCFRIISPTKNYTLQAENALDQMDWVEKITGVIASLLSSDALERRLSGSSTGSSDQQPANQSGSPGSSSHLDQTVIEEHASKNLTSGNYARASRSLQQRKCSGKNEKPIDVLRRVRGNDKCADCGAPEPDWASLNLGVLICIECSGIHRNLGVHISKVRSLVLDVKVWEPSVLTLFLALGNNYANSIWEDLLNPSTSSQADDTPVDSPTSDKSKLSLMSKPGHDDPISVKEIFIHAKYAEKRFVHKIKDSQHLRSIAQKMCRSVRYNDKKAVYRNIVSSEVDVNAIHGKASSNTFLTLAEVMKLQEQVSVDNKFDFLVDSSLGKASSSSSDKPSTTEDQSIEGCHDGCSLLHLACQAADIGMVELLLQYGADINASDSMGQTPLHHCIIRGRTAIAKILLKRGADPQAVDKEGKTPLRLVAESTIDDSEVLALLKQTNR
ncbi:ADP-ribosylation factor GTPase-activating protein AGD3-like isoform X1 [Vitis riparia]|uniref:ADP-ribosylation factor GTPase-activating protein AGD3-like isoform X1 n=1 Tax=Vitis riparia TaxID=96939 RepID=UPI00155AE04B|nr:ADP-ribosylation factor GTPase-activating protein AGD3-like isoform X1 [Vitis riparia]